jgi:mannose-6-phosphate isomerase-like protein (cupin superfamily)
MAGTDQTFNVSYAKDAEFKCDGPRAFFEYRDLGMGKATGGRYHAQVIRARESCAGTGAHTHDLDFQMVYVLKGWVRFDYEGQGEVRLGPGDSVLQPPCIVHNLLECSEDCELIEITSPADFGTHPV